MDDRQTLHKRHPLEAIEGAIFSNDAQAIVRIVHALPEFMNGQFLPQRQEILDRAIRRAYAFPDRRPEIVKTLVQLGAKAIGLHPQEIVPTELVEIAKHISVYGRVALGVTCFEKACRAFSVQDKAITEIVDYFWEYQHSNALDEWEASLPPGLEVVLSLLDDRARYLFFRRFGPDEMTTTGAAVLKMPAGLNMMLFYLDEAARSDIYSAVRDYSEHTLEPTLELLAVMSTIGVPLPDLTPFRRSDISENEGWGNPVSRSEIQRNEGWVS